jgi:hypothetical protein
MRRAKFITVQSKLLQTRIAELQARERALQTRRNALAPLCTLPTEILVHIMDFLLQSAYTNEEREGHLRERGHMGWVAVMGTCTRMRSLILHTPHLWVDINLSRDKKWTELSLRRAARSPLHVSLRDVEAYPWKVCWKQGCTPNFRLFPTTGTCSGHALRTCVCFRTSRTSRTCFGLSRFRLRCCRIGSARSGSRSHGYPIIARTRSTELRRSSAASPYVLTIASSCSADSGLTQPPAAAYASCMTHAVPASMYLNAPGLASCSSVRPLGHWDR